MLPEVIESAAIVLRPFRDTDAREFHSYVNDPDMGRYLDNGGSELSLADVQEIIARHINVDKSQRQVWAVTKAGSLVGAITINFMKDNRISEIGYSVRKSMWGQGIARQTAQLIVDAAFESYPQLQRIQANIHPENAGSIRVAQTVGMQLEGTLRSYAYVDEAPCDEQVYALTRLDWISGAR